MSGDRAVGVSLIQRVVRSVYLDSGEPRCGQALYKGPQMLLAQSQGPRVRQHGRSGRYPYKLDCANGVETLRRNVRGLAVREPSVKRVLDVCCMPRRHKCGRDVWAPQLSGCTAPDVLPFQRDAQVVQAFDDAANTGFAKPGQLHQRVHERMRGGGCQVPQQMHRALRHLDRQFDPRDDPNAMIGTGGDRCTQPADRVVVGHREDADTLGSGARNQVGRVQVTVGRGCVGVQIDQHTGPGWQAWTRRTPVGYGSPMAANDMSDRATHVYSSDSGRVARASAPARSAPVQGPRTPPADGVVRVSRTKTGRGGKTVTLVTGLPAAALDATAKELKRLCGTGGTAKEGVVEIQGDHRERIVAHLSERYQTKLAGG